MDRQRQQRTSRRTLEESSSERRSMLDRRPALEERKSVQGGRSLVSRLGMSEMSCFPSSRSKRTLSPNYTRESRRIPNSSQRTGAIVSPNTRTGSSRQDRGKSRVNPQIPQTRQHHNGQQQQEGFTRMVDQLQTGQQQSRIVDYAQHEEITSDSEEQVFEIPLCEESTENENTSFLSRPRDTETSLRSITCKRDSYSRSSSSRRDDTCVSSPVQGKAKLKEHLQSQRRPSTEIRRPSTEIRRPSTDIRRPSTDIRGRASEVAESSSSSRPSISSSSRLDRNPSRSGDTSPSSSRTNRNPSATGRHVFTRRNITNCFPSLGNNRAAYSSTPQAPSSSLLAAALEPMPPSNPFNSTEASAEDTFTRSENILYSMASSSGGWEYHRPRLMAEGLAKILMALERVESDDELTHEQFLMLEATVLFGGMALHDRHRDWRMDVDNMSYEELLELGERIGSVNTGLSKETISGKLHRSIFFSWETQGGHDNELKCSICQEEYKNGEMLGRIECGHKYHVECIKQWLVHKNLCPICKATAFS